MNEWVHPVTLRGEVVRLEPLGPEHVPDLTLAAQDEEIWLWLSWFHPPDEDAMAAIVESQLALLERGERVPFAQVESATGRAIGMTSYLDIQPEHRAVEIGGTWLGRTWWRTAANTEAKLLLLEHAFHELGANRVALKTDIRNERSQAAIARLGAVREGVLRH